MHEFCYSRLVSVFAEPASILSKKLCGHVNVVYKHGPLLIYYLSIKMFFNKNDIQMKNDKTVI